jgi:hypothetical protein
MCFLWGTNWILIYCLDEISRLEMVKNTRFLSATWSPLTLLTSRSCAKMKQEGCHLPVRGERLSAWIPRECWRSWVWRRICQGCVPAPHNFILLYRGWGGGANGARAYIPPLWVSEMHTTSQSDGILSLGKWDPFHCRVRRANLYMDQSQVLEADRGSHGQDISRVIWNSKVN